MIAFRHRFRLIFLLVHTRQRNLELSPPIRSADGGAAEQQQLLPNFVGILSTRRCKSFPRDFATPTALALALVLVRNHIF